MTYQEIVEAAGRITQDAGLNPENLVVTIDSVGCPVTEIAFAVAIGGRSSRGPSAEIALSRFADMLVVPRHHSDERRRARLIGEVA